VTTTADLLAKIDAFLADLDHLAAEGHDQDLAHDDQAPYVTVQTQALDDVTVAAAAGRTVTSLIADVWTTLAVVRGCPDPAARALMAGHLADQLHTVSFAARDLATQQAMPMGGDDQ